MYGSEHRPKPKTLSVPRDLLEACEAQADEWNADRGARPSDVDAWKRATWADAMRHWARKGMPKPKATKKKSRKAGGR